ncbi:hypothetical protein K439DRAFT_1630439 [Ramaria rubella]|nr:hypothetical protein K439DRAFT_1630439 [Ramaria rubella]
MSCIANFGIFLLFMEPPRCTPTHFTSGHYGVNLREVKSIQKSPDFSSRPRRLSEDRDKYLLKAVIQVSLDAM